MATTSNHPFTVATNDTWTKVLNSSVTGFPGSTYTSVLDTEKIDQGPAIQPFLITQKIGAIWGNTVDTFMRVAWPAIVQVSTAGLVPGLYLPLAGGTMAGTIAMDGSTMTGLGHIRANVPVLGTVSAFNPAGWSTLDDVYLAPTGMTTITGFAAAGVVTLRKTFFNTSLIDSIIIKHEDLTELAANRVHCPDVADLTIPPLGSISFERDTTATRWRGVSLSGSSGGGPFLPLSGGTMLGNINMGAFSLTNSNYLEQVRTAAASKISGVSVDLTSIYPLSAGINVRGRFGDATEASATSAMVRLISDTVGQTTSKVIGVDISNTGSFTMSGLAVGPRVDVISQWTATFVNATQILQQPGDIDQTVPLTPGGGGGVGLMPGAGESVDVGHTTPFGQVEFIFDTPAGLNGVCPVYQYSTGVGTWAIFTPQDLTGGCQKNGIIRWDSDALVAAGWVVGAGGRYWVRVNRTTGVATDPIFQSIQLSVSTMNRWDSSGDVAARSLQVALQPSNPGLIPARTYWAFNGDGRAQFGSNTLAYLSESGGTVTITPSAVSTQQDNYNPASLTTADRIRASTTGSDVAFTGLTAAGSTTPDKELYNVGAAGALVLKHNVTSTAANRFFTPNGRDAYVYPGQAVLLTYDATVSRWRVLSSGLRFGELGDAPSTMATHRGKVPAVNAGETALAYGGIPSAFVTSVLTAVNAAPVAPAQTVTAARWTPATVRARCLTAPTVSTLTITVKVNGSSIGTVALAVGVLTNTGALTTTPIVTGDIVTVDTGGTDTGWANLVVEVNGAALLA